MVLATTKAFIALTGPLPDLHRQVFLRLKTPLLTALASSSPEVSFPVLSHIQLIVATRPAAAVAGALPIYICLSLLHICPSASLPRALCLSACLLPPTCPPVPPPALAHFPSAPTPAPPSPQASSTRTTRPSSASSTSPPA